MNTFIKWLALLFSLPAAQVVVAQGVIQDQYGPLVEWRQASGVEVTPIHVGLLPDGNLYFVNNFNFFENPGLNLRAPGFEPEYLFLMQPTPVGSPQPASVLIQPLANPPALRSQFDAATNKIRFKTLVCSGHSLMADGSLFFASGPDATIDLNLYDSGRLFESLVVDGIAESFTFNPVTSTWLQNPDTILPGPVTGKPLRWYATVTRLADSRMLVAGGYEKVFPLLYYNSSVEVFDPASNAWSPVSNDRETPEGLENPDYPFVFQFPYEHVDPATGARRNNALVIGGSGEPMFLRMNAQDGYWHRTGNFRPGAREYLDASAPEKVFPNFGASSAMLPIRLPESSWGYANGSVMIVGGAHGTPMGARIDVYDPSADAWRPSIPMLGPRHHPSAVILPDGRILIQAGWDDMSPASQTGYAEYVDPRNNFALSRGSAVMPEVRGYHTVSVLLPDGRVLVGGGNLGGSDARERTDFRYYYPDYMTKARPQIVSAPETIRIASSSFVYVPHKAKVGEVVLMGLGAMTHSFDMSQRHVQLRAFDPGITVRSISGSWVQVGPEQCTEDPTLCYDAHVIQAPPTAHMAPPGYYMLFILDENRVPSIGKTVKLEERDTPFTPVVSCDEDGAVTNSSSHRQGPSSIAFDCH